MSHFKTTETSLKTRPDRIERRIRCKTYEKLRNVLVFIKNGKKETVPQEVLLDAAQLAKWFSKAKNHAAADLYCTQVKYLRRAKNGPIGTVLPFHEKNIFVKEDRERLKRLLGKNLL